MHRSLGAGSLALVLLVLGACASRMQDTWTDPSIAGRPLGFHKVATVAMLQEGALRRVAEDELARAIVTRSSQLGSGVEAVPSYTLLEASELADAERMRSKLAAAGCDGAAVISVVDEKQRVTSSPGFSTMHWGHGGAWAIHDTEVRTDTIVRVQTNLYSVESGKLLWSGTSRTMNPRNVSDLVGDVVRDVGSALRDQGLVQ